MTDDGATLAPDDAFELLGNETRVRILQTLGTADEPVPFSELHDRVGLRDSGQFNYHLDRLVGHFLQKTDRKSTRLNSSHSGESRMPSSA